MPSYDDRRTLVLGMFNEASGVLATIALLGGEGEEEGGAGARSNKSL